MFYFNSDYKSSIRYDMGKLLEFSDGFTDLINSYFVSELKNVSKYGEYIIVGEENRPDLVSYKIYGHTQYWWIIMLYNDFLDVNEIRNGVKVLYPSIDSLERLYFKLKPLQRAKE